MSTVKSQNDTKVHNGNVRKKQQSKGERLPTVEELRVQRTQLNRDEFVVYCGLSRGTYYRWLAGKTEAKLTLKQLKAMARLLGVERIEDLPDEFADDNLGG
jgi:transcriptional regulator with XRE-family HTH domain